MGTQALIQDALQGQFVIYAGAGISANGGIPQAGALARRLIAALHGLGYGIPEDVEQRGDLLALADYVEAQGGTRLLQTLCLESGDFCTATPTAEHVAFALLLHRAPSRR